MVNGNGGLVKVQEEVGRLLTEACVLDLLGKLYELGHFEVVTAAQGFCSSLHWHSGRAHKVPDCVDLDR